MPSRKLTDRCNHCHSKNHLRARFCNQCGARLDENRAIRHADGRAKLHADIAHPINSGCREIIQGAVIKAFQEEKERSKLPGYVCRYDDYDDYDFEDTYGQIVADMNAARAQREIAQREGMRVHGPHAPRGVHAPAEQPVAAREESRDFGSGIL